MHYINFNAASKYITRDAVPFSDPVGAMTFLASFVTGESCTYFGTYMDLALLLANGSHRSQLEQLSMVYGNSDSLADIDAFIYFELGGI